MNIKINGNRAEIVSDDPFILEKTLDCGQCFRWNKQQNGSFRGVIGRNSFTLSQNKNFINVQIENYGQNPVGEKDFYNVLNTYFDLERSYASINSYLYRDKILAPAIDYSKGIRILRQDVFEMIISFIISQNNNIPRIKKIIETLCTNFGSKIINDDGTLQYTFPSVKTLSVLNFSDLDILKSGFRQKYIFDAVSKISDNTVNTETLTTLSYSDAKAELLKIKGIGEKVANCILLFGLHKINAFPVDVWIKRILDSLYCNSDISSVIEFYGDYAGIAQQYLFYYSRENIGK